ncbi:MAG: hypothetical protein ABSH26_14275 [Opitutaceae bacterium]|jgi:hypothetical protein
MPDNEIKITLKDATLTDIEAQAQRSKQLYEIQKSVYRTVREPGKISMDFEIKNQDGEVARGSQITLERLDLEASRYRILQGIHRHIEEHVLAAASFSLSFGLSCSRKLTGVEGPPTQY